MRIAIVTQGYLVGGGVPAIAMWLRDELSTRGHVVDVHDLAASSGDARSRRLLSPVTWRRSLEGAVDPRDPGLIHWGADWVELESHRYQPREPLTEVLDTYDLIQVVAGGPALAFAVSEARPPKVLQVATTLLMERRAHLPEMAFLKRAAKTMGLRSLRRLEVKALRSVDEVLVENRWMEEWVRQQGQPNVTFAPPGIDTDLFHPAGEWDPSRPIIAFGRLCDSRKDWPTAVAAYEHFEAMTGLGNELVLAGRGPIAPALSTKLSGSPLVHRITVREDVPLAELPGLLASGSVFLQSSLEEGLGLAGLEAMACGLPVIATKTVGSSEYVRTGENGFLVELGPATAASLGRAVTEVLTGDRGRGMAAAARQTCRHSFSASHAYERYSHVYQSLTT